MKKITIVSASSFAFLLICSLVAKLTGAVFENYLPPLIIGAVVLAVNGILALSVRNSTVVNIICFFISAVSMGFLIRSWYLLRELENTVLTMLIVSLAAVIYLWIFFAIMRIPFIRAHGAASAIAVVLFAVLTITIYIILIIKTKTPFMSTFGYYFFIEASFAFAMSLAVENREELIRNITLSTYSVFVVAGIVAGFAIFAALGDGDCDCDCDSSCCDCIDCGADFQSDIGEKPKRKRQKH